MNWYVHSSDEQNDILLATYRPDGMLRSMTETSFRKRQPDVTQQRLLDVAGELVTESGVMALTLDAVAKRAGVSKGGLLHHFPSKHALLLAMVEDISDRFMGQVAKRAGSDPDAQGRSARAYVRTVVDEPDQEIQRWGALSAAFMSDPSLMADWRARLAEQREIDAAEAADPVGMMIARLAADGLWLADVCRLYGIDDDMRRRIADRLIALTRS
jgi:AcrR family transcriptional regulator